MLLDDAILKRNSVRSFAQEAVSNELLLQLAEAGQHAPTASNLQAWRFLFVTDPLLKEKVDMFSPGLSGKPPVILVICSDLHVVEKKGSKNSLEYGLLMDASMASQNIMLKAVELGLGTCAIKSYNEASVRKILSLSSRYRIELLLSIGYPLQDKKLAKRPNVREITFFNEIEE